MEEVREHGDVDEGRGREAEGATQLVVVDQERLYVCVCVCICVCVPVSVWWTRSTCMCACVCLCTCVCVHVCACELVVLQERLLVRAVLVYTYHYKGGRAPACAWSACINLSLQGWARCLRACRLAPSAGSEPLRLFSESESTCMAMGCTHGVHAWGVPMYMWVPVCEAALREQERLVVKALAGHGAFGYTCMPRL